VSYPIRLLRDDVTYWPPVVENKFGFESHGAPIVFKGRYEERNERVRKPGGDEITSTAVVFCPQPVVPGGFIFKGDASMDPDPFAAGALEIQAYVEVPDIRNASAERRAYL
jgi:hypothetical protein